MLTPGQWIARVPVVPPAAGRLPVRRPALAPLWRLLPSLSWSVKWLHKLTHLCSPWAITPQLCTFFSNVKKHIYFLYTIEIKRTISHETNQQPSLLGQSSVSSDSLNEGPYKTLGMYSHYVPPTTVPSVASVHHGDLGDAGIPRCQPWL